MRIYLQEDLLDKTFLERYILQVPFVVILYITLSIFNLNEGE